METIKKRISDLELASLPLNENAMFEVSQGGVSKRILAEDFYADGWFAKLQASPDSFTAPEAKHSTSADTAEHAETSDSVSGINFASGDAGDEMYDLTLKAGEFWTIPKGTFQCFTVATDSTALVDLVTIADDSRVQGSWMLTAPFPAGLILSDGSSLRIKNKSTTTSHVLTFRTIAHS